MQDPWGNDRVDVAAYLRRIGVPPGEPDRALLDTLHEAHVRTFTFDNFDVLLRQHPGVGLDAVNEKFVGRGRGGYCFEHATLFAAVLTGLGYDVERRLGRVGDAETAPRTHCVVVIRLDGEELFADPGLGLSLLRPMPLVDGAQDDHGGWAYRLRAIDGGAAGRDWELSRLREGGWEVAHTTDPLRVRPVDLVMSHHYTSTSDGSHFGRRLMLTKHGEGRHTSLTHETITIRRPGEATEHRPLRPGELEEQIATLAPSVTEDERDRLLAIAAILPPV